MAVSTTTTFNDLVGSIVSADAQSAAYANRVFRPLIRGEAVPPGFNNITIPRFQSLAVAALNEGVAPSSTTWNTDGTVLTPTEYGVYVQISKMALHSDPFSDLAPYGEQMGRAMAQHEDSLVIDALLADVTAAVNDTSDPMDVGDFADAVGRLEAANAPGPYAAVLHPYSWGKLRKEIDVQGYGSVVGERNVQGFGPGATNANSFVGSLFGVPIFISSQTPDDGGATPSRRHNFLFSREAVGGAWIKDIGVDVDDNVTARALDLMGWFAFDVEVLVPEYAVIIEDTLTV